MADFTAIALSDQKGYKSVSVKKPDGTSIDIFPTLRDMGLVPKYAQDEFDPSIAYNTRVSQITGNKVVKLKFDVKLMEDKTADDIAALNVVDFNNQKVRHVEDFIYGQKFRKTTYLYSKEDLVDGEKIFGKQIPSVMLARLMAQREVDKEVHTFNELLKTLYHFTSTGITIWELEKDANETNKAKVKKDDDGNWLTTQVKGDTATLVNAYGETKKMLKRVQAWKTGANALSENMQLLGDLDVDIAKTGRLTSALHGHMHLNGIRKTDIITAMPQNALNELATNGARFASAMAQRDMQTGEILQGQVLGSNYVVANNLPDVFTTGADGALTATPKPIKALKFVKGEFAPLAWLSNTGLDAVADYPDYPKQSATTHRILETTNEWQLTFIKQYSNLIYVVYGTEDYNAAEEVA